MLSSITGVSFSRSTAIQTWLEQVLNSMNNAGEKKTYSGVSMLEWVENKNLFNFSSQVEDKQLQSWMDGRIAPLLHSLLVMQGYFIWKDHSSLLRKKQQMKLSGYEKDR